MPAIVLSLSNIAILTRLTRAAMLDILGKEFVRVARAKGLAPRTVTRVHVLPNAAVPILTVLGLEAAHLMTGAAVVEYVFAWPGIGKMAVDAALRAGYAGRRRLRGRGGADLRPREPDR